MSPKLPDYLCSAIREASLTFARVLLEHEECSIPDAGWDADECSCPHHRLNRADDALGLAIERAIVDGLIDPRQLRPTELADGLGGHQISPGREWPPRTPYDRLLFEMEQLRQRVSAHKVHCSGQVFAEDMTSSPCPVCFPSAESK